MKSLFITILIASLAFSCNDTKRPIFTTEEGAIKGYDPVAYFSVGMPVKGKKEYTCKWMESMWYFASDENRQIFESNPDKYAPQYGGYCAYGVAMGELYKVEPDSWGIVDGKLYLNFDSDIQKDWQADQNNFITQGDLNWPKIKEAKGF